MSYNNITPWWLVIYLEKEKTLSPSEMYAWLNTDEAKFLLPDPVLKIQLLTREPKETTNDQS